MGTFETIKNEFKSITIEPVILLFMGGLFIIQGAQLNTNLLIWKICTIEKNYSSEICDNLTLDKYDDQNTEVQQRVNEIQSVTQYLVGAPGVLFSLFAGALSDDFGRKPFIMLPLFGLMLTDVSLLVNYIFIETLPTEFFYLEYLWYLFGGVAVIYLGLYGYVATITTPEDRAYRLARLDGIETAAMMLGTFLSPIIFDAFGYYASFGARIACSTSAFLYVTFVVKEPVNNSQNRKKQGNKLYRYCVKPVKEMFMTLSKPRPNHIRTLIMLQLFAYLQYWLVVDPNLEYLFLLKTFQGFDYSDYSPIIIYFNGLSVLGLLVIVPIMSKWLKMHDAAIQTIITYTESLMFLCIPFVTTLWQFYLVKIFGTMAYSKWSIVRSLMSKSVDSSELGKALSGIAVVAAIQPFIQTPMFRGLYNATLDNFPGAVMLMAASTLFLSTLLNFLFYVKRKAFTEDDPTAAPEIDQKDIFAENFNIYIGLEHRKTRL